MTRQTKREEPSCAVCADPPEHHNPLVPDEFYDDVALHLHCLNSGAGRAWIEARAKADPLYARYWSLITVRQPTPCSACGSAQAISPKASGMSAGIWEAGCTACSRSRPLLNGYRSAGSDLAARLARLAQEFKLARRCPADVLADVARLAAEAESLIGREPCACGGTYSLAAHPRCTECHAVLIDSPFHVTSNP